jgi:hypothetical protein
MLEFGDEEYDLINDDIDKLCILFAQLIVMKPVKSTDSSNKAKQVRSL